MRKLIALLLLAFSQGVVAQTSATRLDNVAIRMDGGAGGLSATQVTNGGTALTTGVIPKAGSGTVLVDSNANNATADVTEFRNGATLQTVYVYSTADAGVAAPTNFERLTLSPTSIQTQAGGTGTARSLQLLANGANVNFGVMGGNNARLSSSSFSPLTAGALTLGTATLPWTTINFSGTSATPGTNNFSFTGASTSGTRTVTLPDASITVARTDAAQTFTGAQTFGTPITVASGGTGLGTLTLNNVIIGNGTSNPTFVAPGTSGNTLTSNGTTWTSAAGGAAPFSDATPIVKGSVDATKLLQFNLAGVTTGNTIPINVGGTAALPTITFPASTTLSAPGAGANSERFGAGATTGTATACAAIGQGASVSSGTANGVAVGNTASATGTNGIAIGSAALAFTNSVSIGQNATSGGAGTSAVTIGTAATGTDTSVTIGLSSSSSGSTVVIGSNASTSAGGSVAVGNSASNTGANSTVLGGSAASTATNSVVLGSNASNGGVSGSFVVGGSAIPITGAYIGGGISSASPGATVYHTTRSRGGTDTDVAGANLTVAPGEGTGTGGGGSFIVQTAPAGSTGSVQNVLATRLTIDKTGVAVFAQNITAPRVLMTGTSPTVGGSCGTSPSIAGKDGAFVITVGTVAPTSCTVTFGGPNWATAPVCTANGSATAGLKVTTTVSTVVISATSLGASESIYGHCIGF